MASSPELKIVGGANGSGKTTYALEYASQCNISYLGADEIAKRLSPNNVAAAQVEAGRIFLHELKNRISGSESFVVETTLSGLGLRRSIKVARRNGFSLSIVYLYLDSPEVCIARISERVLKGGHHVPDADVRRRFHRSISNFWHIYRSMADNWVLLYNSGDRLQDVALGSDELVTVHDSHEFRRFLALVS